MIKYLHPKFLAVFVCPCASLHKGYVSLLLVSLDITENSYFWSQRKPSINLNKDVHLRFNCLYRKILCSLKQLKGWSLFVAGESSYSRVFESCTLSSYGQRWSTLKKKDSSCAALWCILKATVQQFVKFGKKPLRVRSEVCKWKGLRTDNF